MRDLKGYIMILGAAVCWGLSATAAKAMLNQQVSTLLIVQTRVTFSCLMLLAFYLAFRPHYLRVAAGDLYHFALLGMVGVAGSNFTYYFTIKESTVATAILIQYTAPLLVVGYGALTKEEEFTAGKLAAALLSLAGCFLAVGGYDLGVLKISGIGLVTGVASTFCFAFLNVYTRRVLARYTFWTTVFYSLVFASAMWMVIQPPWTVVSEPVEGRTWGILVLFAVLSILIPHTLYFSGLRFVVPSRAIIASTLEPIVAIVSAALLLGEYLQQLQVVGAAAVIGAIVVLQMRPETGPGGSGRAVVTERADAA